MARLKQTIEERREKAKWSRIKRVYGLSKEQYDELNTGSCPICLREFGPRVRPCVDHDHKTLEVRGVICLYCNLRIIGRHRDGDLLHRAGVYVTGPHRGWLIPKKKRNVKRKKR